MSFFCFVFRNFFPDLLHPAECCCELWLFPWSRLFNTLNLPYLWWLTSIRWCFRMQSTKKEKSFSVACGLSCKKQHMWNVAIFMHNKGRDKKRELVFGADLFLRCTYWQSVRMQNKVGYRQGTTVQNKLETFLVHFQFRTLVEQR